MTEKCCGNCKWWVRGLYGPSTGICKHPIVERLMDRFDSTEKIPESLDAVVYGRQRWQGKDCPIFEAKEEA